MARVVAGGGGVDADGVDGEVGVFGFDGLDENELEWLMGFGGEADGDAGDVGVFGRLFEGLEERGSAWG